jgi:low affinity Fe/Cu permease
VVGVHILKNILIPIVTVIGLELGSVIAFAIITESIFAWPGTGKLLIDSINQLDRPVIVAYLLVIVTIFIFINFVVDVLYSVLDPRVRLGAPRRRTSPMGVVASESPRRHAPSAASSPRGAASPRSSREPPCHSSASRCCSSS